MCNYNRFKCLLLSKTIFNIFLIKKYNYKIEGFVLKKIIHFEISQIVSNCRRVHLSWNHIHKMVSSYNFPSSLLLLSLLELYSNKYSWSPI